MDNDLRTTLDRLTCEATLYTHHGESSSKTVRCLACAHHCRISEDQRGLCNMRFNRDGNLFSPWGYVSGLANDPIEKKPFYHVLPGADALSFGMLGCNFRCSFCQNWRTSQTLRDPQATGARPQTCTAEELVRLARQHQSQAIASTYNEPLITAEWAREIFTLARQAGLLTCFVSNGFASPEALDYLCPVLDAMNVDLKCFTDEHYRELGGRLQPVLETIRSLHERGKWVEVVTLIVPGFNDGKKEIEDMAEFVASVSPDIPWHVTAFHADYQWTTGPDWTPPATVLKAVEAGHQAGLRYVYGGNLSGLGEAEHTRCPNCHALLLDRHGFLLRQNRLKNGCCPACQTPIPGIWRPPTAEP
jgi:pyruvate formate lyase activating enzyme